MRNSKTALVGTAPLVLALGLSACSFSGGAGGAASASGGRNVTISMQFTPKSNFALETDDAFVLSQLAIMAIGLIGGRAPLHGTVTDAG